ncbi:MAG: hypothetical protein AAF677_04865 [Pseudomonadota bacterium]
MTPTPTQPQRAQAMPARRTGTRAGRAFVALTATLALAACAIEPTPYVAATAAGGAAPGYADAPIGGDRYRVSFTGNRATPRAVVGDYLLFRAAEVTLAQGADWFRIDRRGEDTLLADAGTDDGATALAALAPDAATATAAPVAAGKALATAPAGHTTPLGINGRVKVRTGVVFGFGYPFFPRPFGYYRPPPRRVGTVAFAEITLFRGPLPEDDVSAFDARAVVEAIGPRIARPIPPR